VLSDTSDTLERWLKVQMMWCSLESVFTGGDIAKQMPLEAKKFAKVSVFEQLLRVRMTSSYGENSVNCIAQMTLLSAVRSSPSCVALACQQDYVVVNVVTASVAESVTASSSHAERCTGIDRAPELTEPQLVRLRCRLLLVLLNSVCM
jgi:Dynein heavy chain, N-terminal region 2